MQMTVNLDRGRLCACGCGKRLRTGVHGNTLYRDECQARIDKERREAHFLKEKQERQGEELEAWYEYDLQHPEVWPVIDEQGILCCIFYKRCPIGTIIEFEIRLKRGIHIPNAFKKFYKEKFIAEHPEHAHLFSQAKKADSCAVRQM